jgi:ribosome maturation factor RimP
MLLVQQVPVFGNYVGRKLEVRAVLGELRKNRKFYKGLFRFGKFCMRSKSELWQMFEPDAREMGLEIFEIEVPNSRSRVLRIYLARSQDSTVPDVANGSQKVIGEDNPIKAGVSLDECALFSKKISRMEGFEDLFHEHWTLEVSSPGINRRLTRPEHFKGAVGERVKVKFRGESLGTEDQIACESQPVRNVVTKGILTQFDGKTLTIEDEEKLGPVKVEYALVNEARVDFLFTRER